MITFTMNITQHDPNKGFCVSYTPDDPDCTTITQWIDVGLIADKDTVLSIISANAPQYAWENQKKSKTVDVSYYADMVGTTVPSTAPPAAPQVVVNKNPTEL